MKHFKSFEHFRNDGKIDLHRLHRHSLSFMQFIGAIIDQRDPAAFQTMLIDNYNLHRRAHVNTDYLELNPNPLWLLDKCCADENLLSPFIHADACKSPY